MIFDKKSATYKFNTQSVVVGYDLGEKVSQISVAHLNGKEPETLSTVAGGEQYNIPTVLCKRHEVNQWFYGKEAVKNADEGEGILVGNLISRTREGKPVDVEGMQVNPIELLALFVKKSFSMLGMVTTSSNVVAVMITVDRLDARMVEILLQVMEELNIRKETVYFQSHEESAFYYIMNQSAELWKYQVGICDFEHGFLKTYCLETNKRTIPMVSFIEEKDYPGIVGRNDEQFLKAAVDLCKERIISSVFLIGEDFQGEWCKRTLGYLCNGRRVFQGNNLYSKGACYAIMEKVTPGTLSKEYVFLGKEKLKSNIGMKIVKNNDEAYYVLLDAGENWYDAKKEVDFLLEAGNTISIYITPLNETENKVADIILSGIPMRPRCTTRVHMEVSLRTENILHVFCKDMGFGDIFKSMDLEWREEFQI